MYSMRLSELDQPLLDNNLLKIEDSNLLLTLYLAVFLFAEAAFILMAISEYLQDVLKISEVGLITNEVTISVE